MRAVFSIVMLAAMLVVGASAAAGQNQRGQSGGRSTADPRINPGGIQGNPGGSSGMEWKTDLRGTIRTFPGPNLDQDAGGTTQGGVDGPSSASDLPADPVTDRAADRAVDQLIDRLPLVAKQRLYA